MSNTLALRRARARWRRYRAPIIASPYLDWRNLLYAEPQAPYRYGSGCEVGLGTFGLGQPDGVRK